MLTPLEPPTLLFQLPDLPALAETWENYLTELSPLNAFGYFVMFLWIPVVLYLFKKLPVPLAVITSFLVAWLLLPVAALPIEGLPDYTKMSATCYGVLLATILFDGQRFRDFRFHWIDLPMILWCVSSIISSLVNGLGWYDGFTGFIDKGMEWFAPYFLGRLYLNHLRGLRWLAMGILVGGILYMPLCWVEIRLSPQLHNWVYGYSPFSFLQAIRWGGYRPSVFMNHGLMVGTWMMAACLIGLWLWYTKTLPRRYSSWLAAILCGLLLMTFVLLRSTGALMLFALGLGLLWTIANLRTRLPLLAITALMIGYLAFASIGGVSNQFRGQIFGLVSQINVERAQSLDYRLSNEQSVVAQTLRQPIFGWGRWGRAYPILPETGKPVVVDSFWIIAFGEAGWFGLSCIMTALVLPGLILIQTRLPPTVWMKPEVAPVAALIICQLMYTLDCLVNAMVNPIFSVLVGGLAGLVAIDPKVVSSRIRQRQQLRAKQLIRP
jgi:hypothetical protein